MMRRVMTTTATTAVAVPFGGSPLLCRRRILYGGVVECCMTSTLTMCDMEMVGVEAHASGGGGRGRGGLRL